MIELILPDGAVRQVSPGINGAQFAEQISPSLAKRAAAMVLDGEIVDLSEQITKNASCEIITRDDPRALELIRHDAAHVMAEAVQELWPGTQVTIGPAIENGFYYDFARSEPFTPDDLPKIETRMREIIARNAPFTKEVWTRDQAKSYFAARGEHYKGELIDAIGADEPIKIYRQGSWLDLCRGPHMVSTGQIGSAFKLTRLAGAYWRGDAKNAMLTRIYGIAFATDKQLKSHLNMLAEAEKRDHRRLGRELDLFHFQEDGPGVVFWHPKGWTMFQTLINHMRRRLAITGYQEVNAPQILDRSMWETSGHWDWYRENMFVTQTEDERVFAIKPMNCPGHVQIFKHGLKSYRDLPIRYAEFGAVSRYEPSGALHGLMRVRAFTQDDAHVFCTEAQLAEECLAINDLILATYGDFGFQNIRVVLSTRPEERVGDDASWDHAEAVMRKLLVDIEERSGGRISVGINPGDGAFYGPKFDYYLRDAIGREWQCGTTQLDFNLPARFESFYIDHDGEKKVPIMIHRAICGSMERFLGILIENFAGNFPLWFAPLQCVVTTITNEADDYASQFCDRLRDAGIRAVLDLRNEKINYKVREHSLQKVPIIAVCGAREAEEGTVSLRRLGSKGQTLLPVEEAIALMGSEAALPPLS